MSSLRTCAAQSVITAVLLFSPALAFLMAIAAEILIDLLVEAGAPAILDLVAVGAIGWVLFRKMSPRPKGAPLSADDEPAIAAPSM
jgi:uncharacterized membrane protein